MSDPSAKKEPKKKRKSTLEQHGHRRETETLKTRKHSIAISQSGESPEPAVEKLSQRTNPNQKRKRARNKKKRREPEKKSAPGRQRGDKKFIKKPAWSKRKEGLTKGEGQRLESPEEKNDQNHLTAKHRCSPRQTKNNRKMRKRKAHAF